MIALPRFLFLVCLLIKVSIVYGQNQPVLPQIAPKSPNAAGFEKYGDIPVSMNTGVPNISIPLTSISIDGLSIPITLSYHNTGLKPEELASWVGYGWNLEAGGMLNIDIRGVSDFDQARNGLYYGWPTTLSQYFRGAMNNPVQQYNFFEEIMNKQLDGEFDKYTLKFLNHNYMFYFDTLQQPRFSPRTDLKLEAAGYKVTDLSGNQFFFQSSESGGVEDVGDVEIRPFAGSVTNYLSRIVTRNGRVIRFTYQSYSLQYNKNNGVKRYMSVGGPSGCPWGTTPEYSSSLFSQQYLLPDSIVYDGGYVKFTRTTNNRLDFYNFTTSGIPALADIKIVNSNGKVINQFFFTQGYFQGSGNEKLKLSSIQEQVGAMAGRRWEFKYWGENDVFPGFYSNAIDHWGYYNGKQNGSLFPRADYRYLINGPNSLGGADRTSDFRFAKLGLLKTIRYPTGGTTHFEYEPNQIKVRKRSEIFNLNPFLQWPENTFPVVRTYITSGNSAGSNYSGNFTLGSGGVYELNMFRQLDPGHISDAYFTFTGPQAGVDALNFAANEGCGTNACSNFKEVGLPAGNYGFVCHAGEDTYNNVPLVTNFDLTLKYDDTTVVPPFEAGGVRIREIISTDSSGVNPGVVKRYRYSDSLNEVVFRNLPYYITKMKLMMPYPFQFCEECPMQYTVTGESVAPFVGSNIEYPHVTELFDSLGRGGKIEYTYMSTVNDGGNVETQPMTMPFNTFWRAGNVIDQKTYKYHNNQFSLIEEINNGYYVNNGQNQVRGLKVEYSQYCTQSSPSEGSGKLHRIGTPSMYTEQIFQNRSVKKQYLGGELIDTVNTSAQSIYHLQPTVEESFDSRHRSVRTISTFPMDFVNRNLASTSDAVGIKLLANANIFEPIEQIEVRKINGTDYVVGGTIKTYLPDKPLVAKIFVLKKNVVIPLTSFVKCTINASGAFVKDAAYEERIIFNKYDNSGNVCEVFKKDDQPIAYIWDYKKMFPVAEVKNADSNSIAFTSFEADGKGGFSFSGTPVNDVSAPTGNKAYSFNGSNAITKSELTSTVVYIVSYWTKNASPFTIAGTQTGFPIQVKTVGAWKCFEHRVTGQTQISINASSGVIDEIRLYPANSKMNTYTYEPLIGMSSSCDEKNNTSYYEYDTLGRLLLVRDENKNVSKKYCYNYAGQTENCYLP